MAVPDLPLVTIITPTYNRADYLPGVIDSILAQDYPNFEYIVLDDGSNDDGATVELLKSYEGRLHWETHANMGEVRTVNKGWQMARGELIAIINSDDPVLPGLISAAVRTMQANPDVLVAYPEWLLINAQGETIQTMTTYAYDYIEMLRWHHCMPGPGTFIRRRALELENGRNVDYKYTSDFELWLRLGLHGPFTRIPETLATFRLHPGGATSAAKGVAMADEHIQMLDSLYKRPDVTPAMRRVRSEAYSAAHYIAAIQCLSDRPAARRHFIRSILLSRNSHPNGLDRSWDLMAQTILSPSNYTRLKKLTRALQSNAELAVIVPTVSAVVPTVGVIAPTVSVIIPTYNRAELLRQAVDSVLAQTFDDYEILVVDDGSTDETDAVVASYGDKIRFFKRAHGGVSAARNYGIEQAQGRYVTFLDSDDLFLPHKLAAQVRVLDANPTAGMVYASYNSITSDGSPIATHPARHYPGGYREMMLACTIATPTVMVRRDVLVKVGAFDTQMHLVEDIDLWCRTTRAFPITVIDEPVTLVRLHGQNTARQPEEILNAYVYMLNKAFRADRSLGIAYRRRALARVYYLCAADLLAQTGADSGPAAAYFYRAARYWPFSRTAIHIFRTRLNQRAPTQHSARVASWVVSQPSRARYRGQRLYWRVSGRAEWAAWKVRHASNRAKWITIGRLEWLGWKTRQTTKRAIAVGRGRVGWLKWVVRQRRAYTIAVIRGRGAWLKWAVRQRSNYASAVIRGRGHWLIWAVNQRRKYAIAVIRGRSHWLKWAVGQQRNRLRAVIRGRIDWLAWMASQTGKRIGYKLTCRK